MQTKPNQSARGVAWERSRMDRLVTQYQGAQPAPGRDQPLNIEQVSRLWMCLRREGYGLTTEQEEAEE